MHKLYLLLVICVTTSSGFPRQERIIGGSVTDIGRHPFMAAVLFSANNANFRQVCGATILNNRSILTARHCWRDGANPNTNRFRVGSTNAHSGGAVHNAARLISSPCYNVAAFMDCDIGLIRSATAINMGNNVRVGSIAGTNFNVPDNQLVWAAGWGLTAYRGSPSEQLRQVQIRTVNQGRCQNIYGANRITANMLCAGWDSNGRGVCTQDSGGPLSHSNTVFGVVSFGTRCGEANFPTVFVRVSRFTNWIRSNA